MGKGVKTKILVGLYLVTFIYWLALFATGTKYNQLNYWYQTLLAVVPLTGGLFGLANSKTWGGLKSKVGKGVFFISLGLITWGIGQCFWSYYTIRQIAEVPYPSLADAGYIVSWPLWTIGIINLSKATGARFALRRIRGKAFLFVIPVAVAALSYSLLITVARDGVLDLHSAFNKTFFDLAYPLGDVVILTFALLVFGLSKDYLGGKYRRAIVIILSGFALNYFTDFVFSYTTTKETYYNGHWVDLMFPTVMAIIGIGIALLKAPVVGPEPASSAPPKTVAEGS